MAIKELIVVASLPSVQRDLFLSRCVRRVEDGPTHVDTLGVQWDDMVVAFGTDGAISECSVEVASDISLPVFTKRLESLLDCGSKSDSLEWTLKWSGSISDYGDADEIRRFLCDKIASIDDETGETVGVLKIKRRAVKKGHAKVRIVPEDDSVQVVCRHTSAQGLKSVWKSVLWRLRPQYPSGSQESDGGVTLAQQVNDAVKDFSAPCVWVHEKKDGSYFQAKASWLSRHGHDVDLSDDINVMLDVVGWRDKNFDRDTAEFHCWVQLKKLPPNMPNGIKLERGEIIISLREWEPFQEKAQALSDWLDLEWEL